MTAEKTAKNLKGLLFLPHTVDSIGIEIFPLLHSIHYYTPHIWVSHHHTRLQGCNVKSHNIWICPYFILDRKFESKILHLHHKNLQKQHNTHTQIVIKWTNACKLRTTKDLVCNNCLQSVPIQTIHYWTTSKLATAHTVTEMNSKQFQKVTTIHMFARVWNCIFMQFQLLSICICTTTELWTSMWWTCGNNSPNYRTLSDHHGLHPGPQTEMYSQHQPYELVLAAHCLVLLLAMYSTNELPTGCPNQRLCCHQLQNKSMQQCGTLNRTVITVQWSYDRVKTCWHENAYPVT